MKTSLIEKLMPINEIEERILVRGEVDPSVFMRRAGYLSAERPIEVRRYPRFIHYPRHNHNHFELIYQCRGSTTHIISNNTIKLKEADLLLVGKDASHEIMPAKTMDIGMSIIIMPEFLSKTDFSPPASPTGFTYYDVADLLAVQNLVEILVYNMLENPSNVQNLNFGTTRLLFTYLASTPLKAPAGEPGPKDRLTDVVLEYIEENYKNASLTELSSKLNYDMAWTSKEIKRQLGKTFKELLHDKRMNLAAYLLVRTKAPVGEITETVGYENSSFFHNKFRERYHMSPREYREKFSASAGL